jgi:hypothetical protein
MSDSPAENRPDQDPDAFVHDIFSKLSEDDIEILENVVSRFLSSPVEDVRASTLGLAIADALPKDLRKDEVTASGFLYGISQIDPDELEVIVGGVKGGLAARARRMHGYQLRQVFQRAVEGSEDWRNIVIRSLEERSGEEIIRTVEVVITRNDGDKLRLEGAPNSIASLGSNLIEEVSNLPDEFINDLSVRQIERLMTTLSNVISRLAPFQENRTNEDT